MATREFSEPTGQEPTRPERASRGIPQHAPGRGEIPFVDQSYYHGLAAIKDITYPYDAPFSRSIQAGEKVLGTAVDVAKEGAHVVKATADLRTSEGRAAAANYWKGLGKQFGENWNTDMDNLSDAAAKAGDTARRAGTEGVNKVVDGAVETTHTLAGYTDIHGQRHHGIVEDWARDVKVGVKGPKDEHGVRDPDGHKVTKDARHNVGTALGVAAVGLSFWGAESWIANAAKPDPSSAEDRDPSAYIAPQVPGKGESVPCAPDAGKDVFVCDLKEGKVRVTVADVLGGDSDNSGFGSVSTSGNNIDRKGHTIRVRGQKELEPGQVSVTPAKVDGKIKNENIVASRKPDDPKSFNVGVQNNQE